MCGGVSLGASLSCRISSSFSTGMSTAPGCSLACSFHFLLCSIFFLSASARSCCSIIESRVPKSILDDFFSLFVLDVNHIDRANFSRFQVDLELILVNLSFFGFAFKTYIDFFHNPVFRRSKFAGGATDAVLLVMNNGKVRHVYSSTSSKSFLQAPQTGQIQSSGMSSKAVPGFIPPSGSPSLGS